MTNIISQIMTKDEFIKMYCENSGFKSFEEEGLIALPCQCDYEECKGWAAIENIPRCIKSHNELYNPNSP